MQRLAITAVVVLLLTPVAAAQTYKPTPVDRCFTLGALRIGPERGSPASPLLHELVGQLAEARAACEQAVKDRPNEGRLHFNLARIRALGGDAAGALEAANAGAALKSVNARVLLGVRLAEQGEHKAAYEVFLEAGRRGNSPHANFNRGVMLANGWGVERDEADAGAAFLMAANAGDVPAMYLMAQRFDAPRFEPWLKKAAEAMLPEGAREPLRLSFRTNDEELLAWYESKAGAGEPWAIAWLGMLHEAGQWVKQDYAAAAAHYRRAGEAGNVPAQWRLARFYHEGRPGVPKDLAEAKRWGSMHQVRNCDEHERNHPGADACDRLAADRYDAQSVVAGVDSFCMRHNAERAVAACSAAVKREPSTVRFRTQLARALAHTGRFDEARREASAAAAKGSGSAMTLLGVMSQRGLGVPANVPQAHVWYSKAADAGDLRGAALVGRPLQYTAPSPAEQAERGDPRAQFNLAGELEREKKYDEAIKWYTLAAQRGFRPAELNLAQMHEKGIGVKQDPAEARKRYRRLADLGDGEARYRAAKLAADAGDYPEAIRYYQRGVRDDDLRCVLDLAGLHEEGRGVKKDMGQAVALYERAAARSAWARAKLGIVYLVTLKDYPKAHHWLRRAADDGNSGARNNLGWMYDRGLGVEVDHVAARDLYLAAYSSPGIPQLQGRGGSPQAHGNLESLYAEGRGAPSGAAAADWYRVGARAGITSAQYRLGMMYAKGEHVPRDERMALEWLTKAANYGHADARKEAAELLYAMGDDMAAVRLGHAGAARRLAAKLEASGQRDAAAELRRYLASQPKPPPPPVYPTGVTTDPGEDQSRTLMVRIAGVGVAHAAGMDAAMGNVYDIIRWFPESDGKAKK